MIFVSYARQDEDQARQIVDELTRRGYEIWFDQHSLLPGQKWRPTIEQAIREASVFIALLSDESVSKRGFVQRELKAALAVLDEVPEGDIFIIPVRLNDCQVTDSRLQELHYVDLFPNFNDGIEKVNQAIATVVKGTSSRLHQELKEADIPQITQITVNPTEIVDGGEVRFLVQAKSNAPVRWLNRSLDGPRGNIYGGGGECTFNEIEKGLWELSWEEVVSKWAPSGSYWLSRVSVRNEGDQTSEEAQPLAFHVKNKAVSGEPVIESVTLSAHRVAAGDSLEVVIRARSQAPVNWLDKVLTGPVRNIYGGGSATPFVQEQPDIWVFRWREKFSGWAPVGHYVLSGIAVGNEAQLSSEKWPDIHIEVVKKMV